MKSAVNLEIKTGNYETIKEVKGVAVSTFKLCTELPWDQEDHWETLTCYLQVDLKLKFPLGSVTENNVIQPN